MQKSKKYKTNKKLKNKSSGNIKQEYINTFTFYVPAPPTRRNGYREKQFDKIIADFFAKGYKLIDTKIISHNGQKQQGFWAMFIVSHHKKDINDINFPELTTPNESEIEFSF